MSGSRHKSVGGGHRPSTSDTTKRIRNIVPAATHIAPAFFLRRVNWRGVGNAIYGSENIRLLEYRPFRTQRINPSLAVV
jgi:hypothetical protein